MNDTKHTPTPSGPWAFYVYIAESQTAYVTMDDDDPQMLDDMTNHNAKVTQLYPAHHELVAALKKIIRCDEKDHANPAAYAKAMQAEVAKARAALAKVQP